MKYYQSLLICCLTLLFATSCMNDFDEMSFEEGKYPYGNNDIEEANTTIKALKEKYKNTFLTNTDTYALMEDSIRIKGRVTSNDESGNVYKQLTIEDENGDGVVIMVNATGTYAYLPVGQEIIVDCRGLYFGGYRKMPQIGGLFEGKIGRLNENVFRDHIRLVGKADASALTPLEVTEAFLADESNKDYNVPRYVHMNNVVFKNGGEQFSPIDGETQNREAKIGNETVVFRMSGYANFALDTIPSEPVNVTGVLTRYNRTWQCMLRVLSDIEKIEKNK